MSSVTILYASTSGHTEYVVNQLSDALLSKGIKDVRLLKAEEATEEDLLSAPFLVFGSGSWNTGGIEGQLNPYMHVLLNKTVKDITLQNKPCAIVALGDERYRYTANSKNHLREFVESHGGTIVCDPLIVLNEPYGQEEKVKEWAHSLVTHLS